jgi:hypothetical protein
MREPWIKSGRCVGESAEWEREGMRELWTKSGRSMAESESVEWEREGIGELWTKSRRCRGEYTAGGEAGIGARWRTTELVEWEWQGMREPWTKSGRCVAESVEWEWEREGMWEPWTKSRCCGGEYTAGREAGVGTWWRVAGSVEWGRCGWESTDTAEDACLRGEAERCLGWSDELPSVRIL